MATPQLPEMSDLANIRDALNLYYYGQVAPTESPVAGLAKEFKDVTQSLVTVNNTLNNRKPPKILAQPSAPPNPTTADTIGGIWVNTSAPGGSPTATLAHYWDSTTNTWVPMSGKAAESVAYTWTAPHVFKSTFNYFASNATRDAAITSPVKGNLVVNNNLVQVYDSGWKTVSLPAGGAAGYGLIKNSANDFDSVWAQVVRPNVTNTFSQPQTFSAAVTFAVSPTIPSLTVPGAVSFGSTLNVGGSAEVEGISYFNGGLMSYGLGSFTAGLEVVNSTARAMGLLVGGKRIYLSSTQPTTAVAGDIWIQS